MYVFIYHTYIYIFMKIYIHLYIYYYIITLNLRIYYKTNNYALTIIQILSVTKNISWVNFILCFKTYFHKRKSVLFHIHYYSFPLPWTFTGAASESTFFGICSELWNWHFCPQFSSHNNQPESLMFSECFHHSSREEAYIQGEVSSW